MNLEGTKTEKNLLIAFSGESQARNRYTYFASQAKKDGFVQISSIFTETAEHEKEHAKRLFKFLEGGEVEITSSFPAGKIGTTKENLISAASGEKYEHSIMYPEFSKIAIKEGFIEIGAVFKNIAVAERYHESRYLKLLENIENDMVFKRDSAVQWKCRNCGYISEGMKAPELCPACAHKKDHHEILCENY
ncbi:MAG: rubrerythrin family protein [Methanosarcinales archaeon]|nr:rubrerythrin family protein [Methanosarcinales archaeon]